MATRKSAQVNPVMYVVTLDFDPDAETQFEFGGAMEGDALTVNEVLAMIVIQIQTPHTTFSDSSPIVWTDEVPTCMSVHLNSPTQVTIVNWNSNLEAIADRYNFQVVIWYDGASYMSHDPTIINASIPTVPNCDEEGEEHRPRVKADAASLRAV